MRSLLLLSLALLAAGCIALPEDAAPPAPTVAAPTAEAAFRGPVVVVDETIDFAENAEGARMDGSYEEMPVEIPAGARTVTFSVNWTSDAPTATTRGVRITLFDASGDRVADCSLDTNVATSPERRACGPTTTNVREGAYKVAWEGFGNIRGHVLVTAE